MTALIIEDERMIADILEEMPIDLGRSAVLRAETLDSALAAVDPSLLMPPWNSRPAMQKPFNFEFVEATLKHALGRTS